MKINFTCSCGKSYSVASELAGKKVRCKKCQKTSRIPKPQEEIVEAIIDDVPVAQPTDDPFDDFAADSPPAAPLQSSRPKHPIRYSAKAMKLRAEHRKNEQGQGFTASNPGLLAPSIVKHILTFPHRFAWRLGLVLFFVGLSFIHWIGIPLALLMAYLLLRYVRGIRSHFISGLIGPAKILSTQPPIVAAYINLTVDNTSCPVVRLFDQPLHKLHGSLSQPRRCSAINYFHGMYPGLSGHWFQPLPTMPEFVSDDETELQRIFQSISESDWAMLEMGLRQLPRNPELRTYRIIRPDFVPQVRFSGKPELILLANPLMKEGGCKVGAEITEGALENANRVATNPISNSDAVAIGSDFVVMTAGLFFHAKKFTQFIPWTDIKVAYVNFTLLEVVKRDETRLLIPSEGIRALVQLEKLINLVVGVGPAD